MLNANKTAVVTGAGRGIGSSILAKLCSEGYSLVGIDKKFDEAVQNQLKAKYGGERVKFLEGDVTDPEGIQQLFERIFSENGSLDILVNNAAITNNISSIAKMDIEKWKRELDVNLNGVFYCTKFALKYMVEKKWGRIVNISSMAGSGGLDRQSSYATSKAGILGFTKNVTIEYANQGITCNAILPGLINTEAVKAMPDMIKDRALDLIPSERFGEPTEVAELVGFLVSEKAAYLNGIGIPIDGGAHCTPITLARTKNHRVKVEG